MSYRILNYCVEIIRNSVENNKINVASNRFPKVIPIVLYTGNQKWTASTSFSDIVVPFSQFNTNSVNAQYVLIDINRYEFNNLLKVNSMITNVMILEKCQTNDEVMENLEKIINSDKSNLFQLKRIVTYLYSDLNNLEKIINLIEESESVEVMSTIRQRLKREYDNNRIEGISQGISQGIEKTLYKIIKNMLNLNIPEKDILRFTNIDKNDFEKIKNNIEKENSI